MLTVGTDCALGKKCTALAITRAFAARGVPSDFRATGQTGILIAGAGIPIDAVVSDFEAGAAEMLSPDAAPDHWDVIEGQGSLTNPAIRCAGLSLNTAGLTGEDAARQIENETKRLGLVVADPMRGGAAFDRLIDACLT